MLNVSELKRGDVIEHPIPPAGDNNCVGFYVLFAVDKTLNKDISGKVILCSKTHALETGYFEPCIHWRKVE